MHRICQAGSLTTHSLEIPSLQFELLPASVYPSKGGIKREHFRSHQMLRHVSKHADYKTENFTIVQRMGFRASDVLILLRKHAMLPHKQFRTCKIYDQLVIYAVEPMYLLNQSLPDIGLCGARQCTSGRGPDCRARGVAQIVVDQMDESIQDAGEGPTRSSTQS